MTTKGPKKKKEQNGTERGTDAPTVDIGAESPDDPKRSEQELASADVISIGSQGSTFPVQDDRPENHEPSQHSSVAAPVQPAPLANAEDPPASKKSAVQDAIPSTSDATQQHNSKSSANSSASAATLADAGATGSGPLTLDSAKALLAADPQDMLISNISVPTTVSSNLSRIITQDLVDLANYLLTKEPVPNRLDVIQSLRDAYTAKNQQVDEQAIQKRALLLANELLVARNSYYVFKDKMNLREPFLDYILENIKMELTESVVQSTIKQLAYSKQSQPYSIHLKHFNDSKQQHILIPYLTYDLLARKRDQKKKLTDNEEMYFLKDWINAEQARVARLREKHPEVVPMSSDWYSVAPEASLAQIENKNRIHPYKKGETKQDRTKRITTIKGEYPDDPGIYLARDRARTYKGQQKATYQELPDKLRSEMRNEIGLLPLTKNGVGGLFQSLSYGLGLVTYWQQNKFGITDTYSTPDSGVRASSTDISHDTKPLPKQFITLEEAALQAQTDAQAKGAALLNAMTVTEEKRQAHQTAESQYKEAKSQAAAALTKPKPTARSQETSSTPIVDAVSFEQTSAANLRAAKDELNAAVAAQTASKAESEAATAKAKQLNAQLKTALQEANFDDFKTRKARSITSLTPLFDRRIAAATQLQSTPAQKEYFSENMEALPEQAYLINNEPWRKDAKLPAIKNRYLQTQPKPATEVAEISSKLSQMKVSEPYDVEDLTQQMSKLKVR